MQTVDTENLTTSQSNDGPSQMLRIVIIVPYGIEQSGIIINAARLHGELRRRQVVAYLLTISSSPHKDSTSLRSIEEVNSWLLRNQSTFDVVYWMGFCQELPGIDRQISTSIILRERFNKKVFFMWERTGEQQPVPASQLLSVLAHRGTDGMIALNDIHANELSNLGFAAKLIHVITPGVDTRNEFTPVLSEGQKRQLRLRLGWASYYTVAIYAGRFSLRKRTDLLVRAWITYSDLSTQANLVLFGSGFGRSNDYGEGIERMVRRASNVSIMEFTESLSRAELFQAADLLVLPGVLEGEPTVLCEAMACGIPVVASEVPGHTGLVRHGETGLLFKPNDLEGLHLALMEVIGNPSKRLDMGWRARTVAERERNITLISAKLLTTFETSLIAARRTG